MIIYIRNKKVYDVYLFYLILIYIKYLNRNFKMIPLASRATESFK